MFKTYILQIKTILLFLLILSLTSISGYSQKIAKEIPKPADYELQMGDEIGYKFSQKCSASTALVKSVEENQINFSVIEYLRFTGDQTEGKKEISVYYNRNQALKIAPEIYIWWSWVDMRVGVKTMVFVCNERDGRLKTGFVTSDSKYFSKIKAGFELTEEFKRDANKFIDYFENDFESDDDLTKGITSRFSLSIQEFFPDIGAYVAVNFLEKKPFSEYKNGTIFRFLTGELVSPMDSSIPYLRIKTIKKLINIANGEGKNGEDAIMILALMARYNPNELIEYLKVENTENIQANLQNIDLRRFSGDYREALTNLLSKR